MCRAVQDGGRRCPKCSDPARRSARDRARYAAATSLIAAATPRDTGRGEPEPDEVLETAPTLNGYAGPIPVTEHNRDLLAGLTQDDIDRHRLPYKKATIAEVMRLRSLVRPEDVPVLGENPTPEEMARLAEVIDRCYETHTATLAYAGGYPDYQVTNRDALAVVYGSADKAVVALGEAIARRAESYAAVTAEEVQAGWDERMHGFNEDRDGLLARLKADDPDPQALSDAVSALEQYMTIAQGSDETTRKDLSRLADGYRRALGEVRPLGGELDLHDNSAQTYAKRVAEAAQVYPTDWIEASNSAEVRLLVGGAVRRGHYTHATSHRPKVKEPVVERVRWKADKEQPRDGFGSVYSNGKVRDGYFTYAEVGYDVDGAHGDGWVVYERTEWETLRGSNCPQNQGWRRVDRGDDLWIRPKAVTRTAPYEDTVSEIRLSKPPSSHSPLPGQHPMHRVAVHELGHRMQHVVPTLAQMEHDWRERRTTLPDGTREEPVVIYKGTQETGWRDEFVDAYVGRDYGGRASEVLTVGAQSLFAGDKGGLVGAYAAPDPDNPLRFVSREDRDFRAFVLGAMAAAGRSRT